MGYVTRLLIAVVLGLAAAAVNWLTMSAQIQPAKYVAFDEALERGDTIREDDLRAVPVPGDPAVLRQSLIPFSNRALVLGSPAVRDYQAGDFVFAQDIQPPDVAKAWDVIGPFQLISVGERLKQRGQDASGAETSGSSAGTTRGNSVTIAVDANFDEATSQLLQVIAGDRTGAAKQPSLKIVAVQVVPANENGSQRSELVRPQSQSTLESELRSINGSSKRTAEPAVVYQTVSLDGIPNVPTVLLEGDLIRFVVPHQPRY